MNKSFTLKALVMGTVYLWRRVMVSGVERREKQISSVHEPVENQQFSSLESSLRGMNL
jgi:hypothetical protein